MRWLHAQLGLGVVGVTLASSHRACISGRGVWCNHAGEQRRGFTGTPRLHDAATSRGAGGSESGDAACSSSPERDAPAPSVCSMWWSKAGVRSSKAFVSLDFKRRLREVTLSRLVEVLREVRPCALAEPLTFNVAQNLFLMLLREQLLSPIRSTPPELLTEADKFMTDLVRHIAVDEVTHLGPHPVLLRRWLETAKTSQVGPTKRWKEEQHRVRMVTLCMSRVMRTPKTRFTEADVAYWDAVLALEGLEERLAVGVAKLHNIRERFRRAARNAPVQAAAAAQLKAAWAEGRPPPLLNYSAQPLYLVQRLRRTREGTEPRSRAWQQFQVPRAHMELAPLPPLPLLPAG